MTISVQFAGAYPVQWEPNPPLSCSGPPTQSQKLPLIGALYALVTGTNAGDRLFLTAAQQWSLTDTVIIDPSVLATLGGNSAHDSGQYNPNPSAPQQCFLPCFGTDQGEVQTWADDFYMSTNPNAGGAWRLRILLWMTDPRIPNTNILVPPSIVLYDFDQIIVFGHRVFYYLQDVFFKNKTHFVRVDPGPQSQPGDHVLLYPSDPPVGSGAQAPVAVDADGSIHQIQNATTVAFVDQQGTIV